MQAGVFFVVVAVVVVVLFFYPGAGRFVSSNCPCLVTRRPGSWRFDCTSGDWYPQGGGNH